jgi:hypothetical protein
MGDGVVRLSGVLAGNRGCAAAAKGMVDFGNIMTRDLDSDCLKKDEA